MAIVVRRGILRAGSVTASGEKYRARRMGGGWFWIRGRTSVEDGRVLFEDWRDHGVLQRSDERVEIQFRSRETIFVWQDRVYRIGSMEWGQIAIDQDDRPVVRGHVTVSGVYLDTVAPEMLPIIRELAFLLALRSEDLSKRRVIARAPTGDSGVA